MSNQFNQPEVLDIAASAKEKQAIQEAEQRIKAAYHTPISMQVLGARVILLPIVEEDSTVQSSLILTDAQKKSLKEGQIERAIVKSVGDQLINKDLKVGDVVHVFPNTYEAMFSLNSIGYLIYAERNLLCKDIVLQENQL